PLQATQIDDAVGAVGEHIERALRGGQGREQQMAATESEEFELIERLHQDAGKIGEVQHRAGLFSREVQGAGVGPDELRHAGQGEIGAIVREQAAASNVYERGKIAEDAVERQLRL